MEEKFEMFKSQIGGDVLVYEDHMYNCDYNRDVSQRWRCYNRSCRGALYLKIVFEIEKQVGHSHLPVPYLILKRKNMRTIREKSL
jgi:hypothetical protein